MGVKFGTQFKQVLRPPNEHSCGRRGKPGAKARKLTDSFQDKKKENLYHPLVLNSNFGNLIWGLKGPGLAPGLHPQKS